MQHDYVATKPNFSDKMHIECKILKICLQGQNAPLIAEFLHKLRIKLSSEYKLFLKGLIPNLLCTSRNMCWALVLSRSFNHFVFITFRC